MMINFSTVITHWYVTSPRSPLNENIDCIVVQSVWRVDKNDELWNNLQLHQKPTWPISENASLQLNDETLQKQWVRFIFNAANNKDVRIVRGLSFRVIYQKIFLVIYNNIIKAFPFVLLFCPKHGVVLFYFLIIIEDDNVQNASLCNAQKFIGEGQIVQFQGKYKHKEERGKLQHLKDEVSFEPATV